MINANVRIFEQLKAGEIYDDVATAAKLARGLLKHHFPGMKFSVRSERFAGGSSFCASWVDGPAEKEVDRILSPLQGKGFDGSIDMAYYMSTRLFSDGTLAMESSDGTQGSGGYKEAYTAQNTNRDFVSCSFGCYVSTRREISLAQKKAWLAEYAKENGDELADAINAGAVTIEPCRYNEDRGNLTGAGAIRVGNEWADSAFWRFYAEKSCYVAPEPAPEKEKRAKPARDTGTTQTTDSETVAGLTISEHTHTKKGFQMFIVQTPDRVERSEYVQRLNVARGLSGWYSRAWAGTPAGFAFKDQEKAREFARKIGEKVAA